MNTLRLVAFSFLACWVPLPDLHAAGLEWVPAPAPQVVFEGKERTIRGVYRNTGTTDLEVDLRIRLWLTSSRTAAPLSPSQPRRSFRVPAGQTVMQEVMIDLPPVKAKTSFILEWMNSQDENIGKTRLLVYPTVLLMELKTLAGDSALGIFDPDNRIKPWLRKSEVNYTDLEDTELETFQGKLVIFNPGYRENERTQPRLLSKAAKGTPVVWIRHHRPEVPRLEPSSFLKATPGAALVITDAALFNHLDNDPTAHLNLVRLARWAVLREKMDLMDNDF